jgi:hypothetical protein
VALHTSQATKIHAYNAPEHYWVENKWGKKDLNGLFSMGFMIAYTGNWCARCNVLRSTDNFSEQDSGQLFGVFF